jgi:intracellular sulfur oxidation DsrE/DsrF family protein
MNREISDEILNAHIDNELDPVERAELLSRIATDSTLRSRACELWQLKQMVRGAYPLPVRAKRGTPYAAAPRWLHALAASLLVVCSAVGGWLAHGSSDEEALAARQLDAIRADGGKVVLHLFSDEPARMEAALRKAEQLANARDRDGRPLRVEFIANGPGLHLLRVGGSPYATRVAQLRQTHDNLRLLACREAMERMHERGIDVVLLPQVEETVSAESQLAERLTQGWRYVQI